MSIELTPLGKKCNIACTYCYQQEEREVSGNAAGAYDLEAMKAGLLAAGVGKPDGNGGITGWTLFGGESLLFPINDLERMLEWSASLKAPVGGQTNGSLLTERHIALFKKYGVRLGVSIDGPDDLNDARQASDPKATRATTALSMRNLERLLETGIAGTVIITLTTVNAGDDTKLTRLEDWLFALRNKGLRYINLHTLEPHGDSRLALRQERQVEVMLRLRRELRGFAHVSPFGDMEKALLQQPGAHCTFNFCDPYTTAAVSGVDGQGAGSNCGRTNKNGVAYEKGSVVGNERQLALYLTPMEQGGCGGCRFFLPCGGGNCPGEGEGGDWRARSVHCVSLTALFTNIERELFLNGKEPVSMSLKRPLLEYQRLAAWAGLAGQDTPHGDAPHGDIPHGDHGDSPHGDPLIKAYREENETPTLQAP